MIDREAAIEIALDWLTQRLRYRVAAVDDFLPDRAPSTVDAADDPADEAIPEFLELAQPDEPDSAPPELMAATATSPADMERAAEDAEALMMLTPGQALQRDMERWRRPAPPGVPGRRIWRVSVAQEHLSTNMPPDILIDAETGEIVADPWHMREG